MIIPWDEYKRAANLLTHGLDFADVVFLDWANALVSEATPSSSGSRRMKAIGYLGSGTAVVIYAELGTEAISIVSFRPAGNKERSALI